MVYRPDCPVCGSKAKPFANTKISIEYICTNRTCENSFCIKKKRLIELRKEEKTMTKGKRITDDDIERIKRTFGESKGEIDERIRTIAKAMDIGIATVTRALNKAGLIDKKPSHHKQQQKQQKQQKQPKPYKRPKRSISIGDLNELKREFCDLGSKFYLDYRLLAEKYGVSHDLIKDFLIKQEYILEDGRANMIKVNANRRDSTPKEPEISQKVKDDVIALFNATVDSEPDKYKAITEAFDIDRDQAKQIIKESRVEPISKARNDEIKEAYTKEQDKMMETAKEMQDKATNAFKAFVKDELKGDEEPKDDTQAKEMTNETAWCPECGGPQKIDWHTSGEDGQYLLLGCGHKRKLPFPAMNDQVAILQETLKVLLEAATESSKIHTKHIKVRIKEIEIEIQV